MKVWYQIFKYQISVPDFQISKFWCPIFKSQTLMTPESRAVTASVFENGFAAVEAEFVIRTAVPLRPSEPVKTGEELKNCIASIHVGVEIASSPMADINELGPGAIISDFGNNAGLIVGPQIMNWRERAAEDIEHARRAAASRSARVLAEPSRSGG